MATLVRAKGSQQCRFDRFRTAFSLQALLVVLLIASTCSAASDGVNPTLNGLAHRSSNNEVLTETLPPTVVNAGEGIGSHRTEGQSQSNKQPGKNNVVSSSNPKPQSYQNLIQEAERHAQEDQLLAAARKLRLAVKELSDSSDSSSGNDNPINQLAPSHRKVMEIADRLEETIMDLSSPPDPNIWTKQGEVHNEKRDILVYYKLDEKRRLTSRIEFLIEKELLVPLLAVLVETELYNTWVPRWRLPPVGVKHVRKLAQTGRTNQILHVDLEIPWRRDVIISSTGVEDVDATGLLGIHLGQKAEGEAMGESGQRVPSPEAGVIRVEFEACFVFQKCPPNHAVRSHSISRQSGDGADKEELILVGFSMFADAKVSSLFPQWIVNFIVRVAMVRLFGIFIGVAESVHGGRRPDHTAAISRRRIEIYDWIDERVNTMLHGSEREGDMKYRDNS